MSFTISECMKPLMQLSKSFWVVLDRKVAFHTHDSMRSFRVLSNSDINIINSLKLPLLLEASSSKGPSSRWPLKAIPWRPQYSIARSIQAMYCLFRLTTAADVCVIDWSMRVVRFLKHDKKLFIFSMEYLWYSSTEWFFKSSLVSFQLQYGWVMRILALDP